MKIKNLTDDLNYIDSYDYKQPETEIIGIEKISKNKNNLSPNILYYCNEFSNLDNFNKLIEKDKSKNLIINRKYFSQQKWEHKIDNIIITENQKFNSTLEAIQEKINQENYLDYVRKTLYKKVMKNSDIESILKTAYEFFNNPIVVADSTYRLIELFPSKSLGDPVWDQLFESGFVNQEQMRMFDVDQTLENLLKHNDPIILDWGFAENIPRLSIKIHDGNNLFGTIGVLEYNRDIQKQDYEVIKILGEVLLSLLKQNNPPSDRLHILKQSLLANLLDGGILSRKSLTETMNSIDLRMNAPYYLLSSPLKNINNSSLKNLNKDLTLKINNIQTLTHKNNFVIFIYGKNLNNKLKVFKDILKKYQISFGISNKYDNLLQTSGYYQQASEALKIGESLNKASLIYKFSEYAESILIKNCTETVNHITFIHPGVKKLLEYDKENNTDFALTLHHFLKNYKETNTTANKLHIHRNTLSYRLNKCEEIADFDLKDNNECRYIQLSLSCASRTKHS